MLFKEGKISAFLFRMATKLLRLTYDLGQHEEKKVRKDGRDLEAEDTMENLHDRVRDLERRNEALRQRMTTYKHRLQLQDGCRHCPYGAISARINSGLRKNTTVPEKYKKGRQKRLKKMFLHSAAKWVKNIQNEHVNINLVIFEI